jgi:predicted ester cyclase
MPNIVRFEIAENIPTLEGWCPWSEQPTLVRMTRSETNKQIVERFITGLFTDGDLSAVDRYLDPAFINHDPPLPGASDGPDGVRQMGELFRRAFPDWRSEVHQLIAEGDLVVENFLARGTHRGSVMGEYPTGREVVLRGINIFRVADDKIVERWGCLDQLGLFQQLGLSSGPFAAAGRAQSSST